MSQSLVQVYFHIVYSTKERRPFLQDQNLRDSLHSYLAGVCRNLEIPSLKVGGVEDHIHILCRMAKVISISDLIKECIPLKFYSVGFICSSNNGQIRHIESAWK